eukprot:scaffold171053_cov35-Tisochrysis_lutea.AAC.1
MQLVQLIVQNDAAHAIISKLGEMGKMQLRDVSSSLLTNSLPGERPAAPQPLPRLRMSFPGLLAAHPACPSLAAFTQTIC